MSARQTTSYILIVLDDSWDDGGHEDCFFASPLLPVVCDELLDGDAGGQVSGLLAVYSQCECQYTEGGNERGRGKGGGLCHSCLWCLHSQTGVSRLAVGTCGSQTSRTQAVRMKGMFVHNPVSGNI